MSCAAKFREVYTRLLSILTMTRYFTRCMCGTSESITFFSLCIDPGIGEGHALPAGLSEVL